MNERRAPDASGMTFEFTGPIWYWRGPAPFHFLTVPEAQSKELKSISQMVTYGWGMIPVDAQIGKTEFTTSLFHKNGLYVLPVKDAIRKAEGIAEGDQVTARIAVQVRG